FAVVTHVLIALLPFGLLRTYEPYMEWTHDLARRYGGGKALERKFFAAINPVLWVGLYALWAVFTVGVAACVSFELARWALALVVCVFFAWAVILLLTEWAVLGTPRNEKLKFFAGFLALLYVILPMLLAGVLEFETLLSFSYVGTWIAIGNRVSKVNAGKMILISPLILNVCMVGGLAAILRYRYAGILKARRSMISRNSVEPLIRDGEK
ncbi:MAG: hypothetical protein U1E27_00605, partial [Kiritimatiellia bacterium]|nr:hypothetical protein [Kiritimatiellia bacterium]